jgi:hypothetical protein
MNKKSAIIYWLIPAEPERELFQKFIRILAQQFDAPRFEPHITIRVVAKDHQHRNNCRCRTLPESPRKIFQQIDGRPVRLTLREIGFSSKFTKTLFVRLKSDKSFGKLVADLGIAAKSGAKIPRDPHISLLYKRIPASAKRELASTIKLPFSKVTFDSIKAIRCTLPVRNRTDVERWRVIAAKSLSR